ncbi:hypothetical protein JXR93_02135 [bacterium]|nr:hypothetical protein [bacterium]
MREFLTLIIVSLTVLSGSLFSEYRLGQCLEIKESEIASNLEDIVKDVFSKRFDGNDDSIFTKKYLDNYWSEVDIDKKIDLIIDEEIKKLSSDTGFWSKVWSSWSTDETKELFIKITENVIKSEQFNTIITTTTEELSKKSIETLDKDIKEGSKLSFKCLSEFIEDKYTANIEMSFIEYVNSKTLSEEVLKQFDVDSSSFESEHKKLEYLKDSVLISIGATIAKKIVDKIALKIAKKGGMQLLSKGLGFFSGVGAVVSIGSIAWDLWDSKDGAFPLISKELKTGEFKTNIKKLIVESIENSIKEQIIVISKELVLNVQEKWLDFKKEYQVLLYFIDKHEKFKDLTDRVPNKEVNDFIKSFNVIYNSIGEVDIVKMLENENLKEMLLKKYYRTLILKLDSIKVNVDDLRLLHKTLLELDGSMIKIKNFILNLTDFSDIDRFSGCLSSVVQNYEEKKLATKNLLDILKESNSTLNIDISLINAVFDYDLKICKK